MTTPHLPHWLLDSIAGNSVVAWAVAAFWLFVVTLAVGIVKTRLLTRARAIAHASPNTWDDALVYALEGTRVPLVAAIALVPLAQNLRLQPGVAHWISAIGSIGLFAQLGLWASRFLDHWIKSSRARALQDDPEAATGLAAASFIARVVLWALLILLLLDNLGYNVTTLLAGLGVGGIAVGLALQNILGDLFSSLSIVLDKPFQIGHFVVVDNFSGTVENIGLKTTRIRSIGGEMLVFSNTDLTKARLRNYRAMEQRRIVFGFGVTYDTAVEHLQALPGIVRDIVQAQPDARFDRAHFKDFGDSSLNFEVVYWMTTADYTAYMDTQQAINLELLRICNARAIAFAFPTRTVELSSPRPLDVRLGRASG